MRGTGTGEPGPGAGIKRRVVQIARDKAAGDTEPAQGRKITR